MKFIGFAIILLLAHSTLAQMMKTINDAEVIKANAEKFEGKPLSALLKEIAVPIKMVMVTDSWAEAVGAFGFGFYDIHEYRCFGDKHPYKIWVFVKDTLRWHFEERSKDLRFKWTKKDEEKYGGFTILRVSVIGESVDLLDGMNL